VVFWAIFPVLELLLFASNQQKGFGVAGGKLGSLAVPLGFVIRLEGAS